MRVHPIAYYYCYFFLIFPKWVKLFSSKKLIDFSPLIFSETYKYYDLPFCRPGFDIKLMFLFVFLLYYVVTSIYFTEGFSLLFVLWADYLKEKKQTISELLNGDHLIDAPYRLDFRVDKEFEVVCQKNLTKEEVSQFRSAIKRDFIFQMYYDDLPIWAFLGRVDLPILDNKANMDSYRYLLYKHIDFDIFFNKDSVVKINARTDPILMVDLTEDKELYIEFSYSSRWEDSNITFENRMEIDSQSSITEIYWFSIMNSCSTLLLTGLLMRCCYKRVVKKDLSG